MKEEKEFFKKLLTNTMTKIYLMDSEKWFKEDNKIKWKNKGQEL